MAVDEQAAALLTAGRDTSPFVPTTNGPVQGGWHQVRGRWSGEALITSDSDALLRKPDTSRRRAPRRERSTAELQLIDDGVIIDAWIEPGSGTLVVLTVDVDAARVSISGSGGDQPLRIIRSRWTRATIQQAESVLGDHPQVTSVGNEITEDGQYRVVVALTWVDAAFVDRTASVQEDLMRLAPMMVPLSRSQP